MKGPWKIESACLGLRPFSEADKEELEEMLENSAFVQAMKEEFSEAFSEGGEAHEMAQRWIQASGAPWGVVMKDSGDLIGVLTTLRDNQEDALHLKTYYIIRKESFDQGYAQEAGRAAAQYARDLVSAESDGSKGQKSSRPDVSLTLRGNIVKHVHGVNILGFEFTVKKSAK